MNQTWENGKKLNFGPNFGSLGPNLGHPNFFREFYLYKMFNMSQAIIVCNFKENFWSKLKKMAKNLMGLI